MNTPTAVSSMPTVTRLRVPIRAGQHRRHRGEDHQQRHDREHPQPRLERPVSEHELEQLADDEEEAEHRQEHERDAERADRRSRRLRNRRTSSIGELDAQLPEHEARRARRCPRRSSAASGVEPQPQCGASIRPSTNRPRPAIDSTAPSGSSFGQGARSFERRHAGGRRASSETATTGMFMANVEPHQKCSTSQPPSRDRAAPPPPATPVQIAIALARSRREGVDQDRQRRRHHQRAADAHQPTGGDQLAGRVAKNVA